MSSEQANVTSPSIGSLSLSSSSYSLATITTATGSEAFEVFDESSSDEDEIVWAGTELEDDEDFILVPHTPSQPRASVQVSPQLEAASPNPSLLGAMARLTLRSPDPVSLSEPLTLIMPANPDQSGTHPGTPTQAKMSRSKGSSSRKVAETGASQPAPTPKQKNRGRRRRRENKEGVTASYPSPITSSDGELTEDVIFDEDVSMVGDARAGFGSKPVVESDNESLDVETLKYENARSFISSALSNPSATLYSTYARLTLLQSLIIELGLMPSTDALPASLSAARRFLKSNVFVNIGDYLWAREQGPEEIQNVIFPNKKALLKDLRAKGHRRRLTNIGWVKEHGLGVLLVSPFRSH
ncbi:hypothetical protein M422DRAFT_782772 [Sphaerobolus stellatus SS14]|uniref:Uncharacterized protein n=1 Tax=Sphaerobolus stellatus (strain SS14) TaxID=990650 RepID=A0A0C9UIB0_SPHS4|nr:hypothetical protein M422DRAFT_782772 [Sphaerobolus stellatus SS14]